MKDNDKISKLIEKNTLLEEKIAWLEQVIDSQGKEIDELFSSHRKLLEQFKILYSKVGDPFVTRSLKDEECPPHY